MTDIETNAFQRDPATPPPPPPLSSLSLSIINFDIHWWWMGPICRFSILPTSITPQSPRVALTWAPSLIPGGFWSINPFCNMTVCQLPLDEINALSHPSCYLLLQVIDASPTSLLAGQSDMVMKTYAPAYEEADSTVENKHPCGIYSLDKHTWTVWALNKLYVLWLHIEIHFMDSCK